jgi:rhodanese-related sulfurtransferase
MRTWILASTAAALLVMAALLAGCVREDARLLEPQAAFELIGQNRGRSDFLILDVRTPGEFRRGHIEGAVLMNYYDRDFRERFAALDRDLTILAYCHVGSRSSGVLDLAEKLGFKRVFDLRGGIVDWNRAGLPLVRDGVAPKPPA